MCKRGSSEASSLAAYSHFVWRTRHTDYSGKLRPTAAMMAKVVPDRWNFDRLYNEVIQYG